MMMFGGMRRGSFRWTSIKVFLQQLDGGELEGMEAQRCWVSLKRRISYVEFLIFG